MNEETLRITWKRVQKSEARVKWTERYTVCNCLYRWHRINKSDLDEGSGMCSGFYLAARSYVHKRTLKIKYGAILCTFIKH
jgi:hypothetical protein